MGYGCPVLPANWLQRHLDAHVLTWFVIARPRLFRYQFGNAIPPTCLRIRVQRNSTTFAFGGACGTRAETTVEIRHPSLAFWPSYAHRFDLDDKCALRAESTNYATFTVCTCQVRPMWKRHGALYENSHLKLAVSRNCTWEVLHRRCSRKAHCQD